MTSKLMLCDIDGVVLEWTKSFQEYALDHLKLKTKRDPDKHYQVEHWLDVTDEEVDDLIIRFHKDERFQNLNVYNDALEIIPQMKKDGWSFKAITAVGSHNDIRTNRMINLEKHFPNVFDELILVEPHAGKYNELSNFDPAYWVDDSFKHVVSGIDAFHTSFHMKRNHDNRHGKPHDLIITVNNWHGIYNWLNTNV